MTVSAKQGQPLRWIVMRILYVETFYGGSHKVFADQWISKSRHEFQLITMPPRFWKWRQAGSALFLADKIPESVSGDFNLVVVSGMIDLAHLKVLRPDMPPVLLYLHENQFAYPLKDGESRDYRYGMTDLMNILCAETAICNSEFNRDMLLGECKQLFKRLPDAIPAGAVIKAGEKCRIIYPGIDTDSIDAAAAGNRTSAPDESPLVIWNHRHEHDKNPETAFGVLERLRKRGILFRLAILGERFKETPDAFNKARKVLADRIVCDTYPSRDEYLEWLNRGAVVISSAYQENFGLSVIEAAVSGCWPLLPRRLAYPEVMPGWVSDACFWDEESELETSLERILRMRPERRAALTQPLSRWLHKYSWKNQARELDDMAEATAARQQPVREVF